MSAQIWMQPHCQQRAAPTEFSATPLTPGPLCMRIPPAIGRQALVRYVDQPQGCLPARVRTVWHHGLTLSTRAEDAGAEAPLGALAWVTLRLSARLPSIEFVCRLVHRRRGLCGAAFSGWKFVAGDGPELCGAALGRLLSVMACVSVLGEDGLRGVLHDFDGEEQP